MPCHNKVLLDNNSRGATSGPPPPPIVGMRTIQSYFAPNQIQHVEGAPSKQKLHPVHQLGKLDIEHSESVLNIPLL
jgi:hypothetical protein